MSKLVLHKPLHPDDRRPELCREISKNDDIVALRVDLEDTDVGQGLL